jgi:hypothetical protein
MRGLASEMRASCKARWLLGCGCGSGERRSPGRVVNLSGRTHLDRIEDFPDNKRRRGAVARKGPCRPRGLVDVVVQAGWFRSAALEEDPVTA